MARQQEFKLPPFYNYPPYFTYVPDSAAYLIMPLRPAVVLRGTATCGFN